MCLRIQVVTNPCVILNASVQVSSLHLASVSLQEEERVSESLSGVPLPWDCKEAPPVELSLGPASSLGSWESKARERVFFWLGVAVLSASLGSGLGV